MASPAPRFRNQSARDTRQVFDRGDTPGSKRTRRARAPHPTMTSSAFGWQVWRTWVLANMVGELVGFGAAAVLGAGAGVIIAGQIGAAQIGAMLLAVLLVGGVEGACIGLAQWSVLRRAVPTIGRGAWLTATIGGSVVAWSAGMAIGTGWGDSVGTEAEPQLVSMLFGGAAIGGLAGLILSVPQWVVLRRAVRRAGWWMVVHVVAWSVGMLVALAGTALIDGQTPIPAVAAIGATTGIAMGALVACLTGVALVRLLAHRNFLTHTTYTEEDAC